MDQHNNAHSPCQPHTHPTDVQTTLPFDSRLVHRFGAALLTGGHTSLPTYAWIYYARLDVSEAEFVYIQQLCTYWWATRDPFPGEAAIAARMGKTVRTIQGYLRSLEGKGLLHIQTQFSNHGRQHTNAYDLRPFFHAVEGLARLDGLLPDDDATPATPAPSPHAVNSPGDNDACHKQPCDQNTVRSQGAEWKSLCAGATSFGTEKRSKDPLTPTMGEGEGSRAGGAKNFSPQVNPVEIENFDYDSIPPTPVSKRLGPTTSDDPSDQTLAQEIAVLSTELGDNAPTSSVTRARNLCRDTGVSTDRFLRLLDEAAARTRDRQASIVKRRRDGLTPNGMPYLFAVLTDLLHPAPRQPADGGPAPDRRRVERPGSRRRRRDSGHDKPAGSYAAWSNSPAPLPIVEEHPVWRAVLVELGQVLTPENFNAWLASTRALDQEEEVLRVAVPTAFNKTWLEHKLAGKVAGALHKIDDNALSTGCVGRVEYVVDPAACAPIDATVRAS